MPNAIKHIDQAQRNINHLSGFFVGNHYNDWVITVSFYSCVHIIEAAVFLKQNLKFKGLDIRIQDTSDIKVLINKMPMSDGIRNAIKQSSAHEIRDIIVSDNFDPIAEDYSVLWKQSSDARYYCWIIPDFVAHHAVKTILSKTTAWFNTEFKQNIVIPDVLKP